MQLCAARQKRILADVWPSLRQGGILVYSTCTYEECENDDNLEWAAVQLGGEIIAPRDEFSGWGVELTRHGNLLRSGVVPGEGQWAGMLVKCSGPASGAKGDLSSTIRPLRYGVPQGRLKGDKLIPDPDYALSLGYGGEYPVIELRLGEALQYLHNDALRFPDAQRGFNLVAYKGHPLGFVNNLGNRVNTLHPLSRRILMNIK